MPKPKINPEDWVDKYANYLYNYALSKVDDIIIAEDLVQETFFAGIKSANNFKGDASEKTWLVAILKRKIIDHYRRKNSNKGKAVVRINFSNTIEGDENWMENRIADNITPNIESTIENKELGIAIHECLTKLPEKHAVVFINKTIKKMNTEDICKEMNITPSNLWVIIHRTRTNLVNCLDNNWFENE